MKNEYLTIGAVFLIFLSACFHDTTIRASQEKPEQSSIMILGVYHFNNPGMDTYNTEVGDYTSDKRQTEIKDVVARLKAFEPSKIFVEFDQKDQVMLDSLYQYYLNHKIALSDIENGINEVFQIGFRLGKDLKGVDITAIDHPGNWLAPYADFIADTLELQYYQNYRLLEASSIKDRTTSFAHSSVKGNLIHLNEHENIRQNHNYYNNIAIKVKDTLNIAFTYQQIEQEINKLPYLLRSHDFNNIGVELVAEWYKRNLFIYRNILENTEKNDRILVIIGSGHVYYLQQLLKENQNYSIISPLEFLR